MENEIKGAVYHEAGCAFRVWAPNADQLYITGSFNNWNNSSHPMQKDDNGWWNIDVAEASPGDEYRYRIINGKNEYLRIDPYARNVTSSVGNAVITKTRSSPDDTGFIISDLNRMVIYELHIGTFGKQGEKPGPGDLEGAISRLQYLKELGINAVEVMPPAEFSGGYSWGYNPSHIFSVESDYGTPSDFRKFTEKAHSLGIAVIIDVVYNHFGPGDLDLWQFDGWSENNMGGIYFYNDHRAETPWGSTRPDYGRKEVREYIRDNALMWLNDYGADGLRWDMTAFIRNINGSDNDPGNDLSEGWSLMQWVNEEIKKSRPKAVTIAEDLQNNGYLTRSANDEGAGFSTQWSDKFVHTVRTALTEADDPDRDMNALKDAVIQRYYLNAFERVIYTESHDEVSNGKARIPEEVDPGKASSWEARKKSTLGAVLVFTAPGIPMIFQGQEFLEDDWFHDKDPLDWSKKERFSGILQLYKDLIFLRLNLGGQTEGLTGQEIDVYHTDDDNKVIAWHRWENGGKNDSVVVAANFSSKPCENYRITLPFAGKWRVIFNSDSSFYDPEFGNLGQSGINAEAAEENQPPAAEIDVAPYSAVILIPE